MAFPGSFLQPSLVSPPSGYTTPGYSARPQSSLQPNDYSGGAFVFRPPYNDVVTPEYPVHAFNLPATQELNTYRTQQPSVYTTQPVQTPHTPSPRYSEYPQYTPPRPRQPFTLDLSRPISQQIQTQPYSGYYQNLARYYGSPDMPRQGRRPSPQTLIRPRTEFVEQPEPPKKTGRSFLKGAAAGAIVGGSISFISGVQGFRAFSESLKEDNQNDTTPGPLGNPNNASREENWFSKGIQRVYKAIAILFFSATGMFTTGMFALAGGLINKLFGVVEKTQQFTQRKFQELTQG